jgi:hypothetical protein
MFTAALFTIAKLWKQLRFPRTDKLIKKMWYIYTMEFYLAVRKKDTMGFEGGWMQWEGIMLSEVNQA